MSTKRKRMGYEAQFKIKVAEYALESNNCRAAEHFGVSEKLVHDWRKDLDKLRNMSRTKKANRGKSAHHPELENELLEWIENQRSSGLGVSRLAIRLKARAIHKSLNLTTKFKASQGWRTGS